jgi:hypothetical protein
VFSLAAGSPKAPRFERTSITDVMIAPEFFEHQKKWAFLDR